MTSATITDMAHHFAGRHLRPGNFAIDATVGNGHDTLFLAEQVGPTGRIYGFDIQPDAITRTARRLSESGISDRVVLHPVGHQHLAEILPDKRHGRIDLVMFNLGYLPGGDHSITTSSATTLAALAQALELLRDGGLLLVTLYPGHPVGATEAADVSTWADALDPSAVLVSEFRLLNRAADSPFILLLHPGPAGGQVPK